MTKVAVIGGGRMGTGFARGLASKHDVTIGSRDPAKAAALASEVGAVRGVGYRDAVAQAEVLFLAVPWTAVDETLAELGDLDGKVLIDVTNPYVGGGLQLHEDTSDAEEIQRKAPGARVVKGWNTIFAPILASQPEARDGAAVFLAGDDAQAKEIVASLAEDMGFEPRDCGPLSAARDLERLLGLVGTIGQGLPWGSWTLKVLHR